MQCSLSAAFMLYVLTAALLTTSTVARSHHIRKHFSDPPRARGRDPTHILLRNDSTVKTVPTESLVDIEEYEDDEDDEEESIDGLSVPSLHAMQTFGRTVGRDDPRPIQASRKAVVVTKKTYLKKEWCKTQPLKQVVRIKGCIRTKILNNFCYGQCNSFFIPKKAKRDKSDEAFISCGFCRPRRFRWVLVTLRCPGKHGIRLRRKRVQYIKKCRCMALDVSMSSLT